MKSPSNRKALRRFRNRLFLGLGLVLSCSTFSFAREKNGLFDLVPPGDPAYGQLQSLAQLGWVSPKDIAAPSLTRFEVAELILQAQANSEKTAVTPAPSSSEEDSTEEADDDDTLLPPPEETSGPASATGPVTLTPAQESAALAEAAKNLRSLEEAHQYELKEVADKLKAVQTNADTLDAAQYDLRKQLKGIEQSPSISLHGLGRGFGIYQQYSGNYSGVSFMNPGTRQTEGYLDLEPTAAVSKEIRFNSIFRIESGLEPNDTPLFQIRRMTLHFDPSWFSATLGDFDEAYTPLVLWNRDNLDLRYMPEMFARWDDRSKYESFLNDEPNWPFRGLRAGVDVMWLDPSLLSELKASVFLHMIRNGFNDTAVAGSGMYFGLDQYTDWVLGGQLELDSQKMFLGGGGILRGSLKSYGLILDEPLDTDAPGSAYNPGDPSTWAHQYLLGSLKPEVDLSFGDLVLGGDFEWASARYQDDKRNPESLFNDFALLGGPRLKWGDSSLSVNYLNVGPYYYAPLAQTRQDAVTSLSAPPSQGSPDLFAPALRSQYFLSSLPRAGGIFSFYNRLQDNTFPYGLATPNREGFGLELEVKALEKDILKIRGSAYLVREISGNLVVDAPATGFTPVDSPGGTLVPIRRFTYVNVGPSVNLGPALGWNGDLEVGVNGRYEQTTSDLGTLTSLWVLGGIRADLLPAWEVAAAYGFQQSQGDEAGVGGTYYARYSYLYDNSDLGSYSVFHVDGAEQSLRLSNAFRVNRNSKIYLDWDWAWGDLAPVPIAGNILNQFVEISYEIQF